MVKQNQHQLIDPYNSTQMSLYVRFNSTLIVTQEFNTRKKAEAPHPHLAAVGGHHRTRLREASRRGPEDGRRAPGCGRAAAGRGWSLQPCRRSRAAGGRRPAGTRLEGESAGSGGVRRSLRCERASDSSGLQAAHLSCWAGWMLRAKIVK